MRQVIRKIKTLEAEGYISKSRFRKNNECSLPEKLAIKDDHGRPRVLAQWRCHQVDRSIPIFISTKFLDTPLPHPELDDNDDIKLACPMGIGGDGDLVQSGASGT